MLESLKSFFAGPARGTDFSDIAAWAKRRGHDFKREREHHGFVVSGRLEGTSWRLEWGPPQRPYIAGHELRVRMELGLPPDLQMLVLSRPLIEQFEKQAYDQFTASNQTQMGDSSPEEMRWLVMFPKIDMSASKPLRQNFGGVSSLPDEGPAWLRGPLAHALERAGTTLLRHQPPFVLMTLRGRIYLRLQMASPDDTDVAAALALFETAGTEAMRVGKARGDEPVSWAASTLSSAWSVLGAEPVKKK